MIHPETIILILESGHSRGCNTFLLCKVHEIKYSKAQLGFISILHGFNLEFTCLKECIIAILIHGYNPAKDSIINHLQNPTTYLDFLPGLYTAQLFHGCEQSRRAVHVLWCLTSNHEAKKQR